MSMSLAFKLSVYYFIWDCDMFHVDDLTSTHTVYYFISNGISDHVCVAVHLNIFPPVFERAVGEANCVI